MHRRLFLLLQLVFVAAVLVYAARALGTQWDELRRVGGELRPDWALVAASSAVVLLAYALLIVTWRSMLGAWGAALPFGTAARIWFVSNLGKYIPGKVWQIAAMGAMAQRSGVSPVAAAGSALLVNLANIASGFAIVLLTGARVLAVSRAEGPAIAAAAVVLVLAALLALPVLLPWLARIVSRLTGRAVEPPRVPARAVWTATLGTAAAWVLYGLAFALLARALGIPPVPGATGATSGYVAVYTSSYLVGYLALVVPGGLVVREAAMVEGLTALGLATPAGAWLLALASRLWLTVLEVVPGVLYLLPAGRRSRSSLPDDVTS